MNSKTVLACKTVSLDLSPEMSDVLMQALLNAQAVYETRQKEAMTGFLSPDPVNAKEATESLEHVNKILAQLTQLTEQWPDIGEHYIIEG